MHTNRKAIQRQDARLNGYYPEAKGEQFQQPQQLRQHPENITQMDIIQLCQKFAKDLQHHRSITPDRRVCIYGFPSSVPDSKERR